MKSLRILIALMMMWNITLFAQDEEPDNRPVKGTFEGGWLIDNQTVVIPAEKTLEATFEHRFGLWNNGITDVYGIYAPSNIRLGANYSVKDYLQVGFGYSNPKVLDFRVKGNIINQTRSNSIPLGVTFYGNMGISCVNEESFGENYEFDHRFSYFAQLIITRKFTDEFSLQVSPSFSHLNSVDSLNEHDKIGISFGARYKISTQSSIILTYDQPLEFEGLYEWDDPINKPKPSLGIGWEISTGSHIFQVFICSANTLSPQYNMMENQYDFAKKGHFLEEMRFGFNFNRLWSF